MIYDVTDPTDIALAASVPIPPDYGIHDTFVRDGLAFVFAWNSGRDHLRRRERHPGRLARRRRSR